MEKLETINQYLIDNFGVDTITGQPMWRVVWAEDQLERRLTKYTDSGVELLYPEMRTLPKYPWIKGYYILEQLELVPELNIRELLGKKMSYECKWAFHDSAGNPLPPAIWACKFVIDTINAASGKSSLASYAENRDVHDSDNPITNHNEFYESRKNEIDQLTTELFGEQSGLKQAIVTGEGIAVPHNYPVKES